MVENQACCHGYINMGKYFWAEDGGRVVDMIHFLQKRNQMVSLLPFGPPKLNLEAGDEIISLGNED